jgi:glutamate/tyrosine decarboxylase-like PLP-dependent enzyme
MAAFRRAVTRGIDLAAKAEEYARASDTLEIANPASLSIVCFRVNPVEADLDDGRLEEINETIQARIIETGTAMMSSTRLRGLYSLRLCILNHNTTWEDVQSTLEAIERFAGDMLEDEIG